MSDNMNILLVGVGKMGMEYARVLEAQGYSYIPVGRGEQSAQVFKESFHIDVITGGIDSAVSEIDAIPEYAIVAVPVTELAHTTRKLISAGVKYLLVEKPGGLDRTQIVETANYAAKVGAQVYIAYNRRFHASTLKAQEIIEEDGGVTSFNFEFTEWSDTIASTKHSQEIKNNWLMANSTHVMDLAFYLGGMPAEMTTFVGGAKELSWHRASCIYAGAGVSVKGALFSYQANWNAPGRWGVEVLTRKHRLIFRPLEKLQIQNLNSVKIDYVDIDDELDNEFKPGVYRQVQAFMREDMKSSLLSITSQVEHAKSFEIIEKGDCRMKRDVEKYCICAR